MTPFEAHFFCYLYFGFSWEMEDLVNLSGFPVPFTGVSKESVGHFHLRVMCYCKHPVETFWCLSGEIMSEGVW